MRNKILTILEAQEDFISGEWISEQLGVSRAAIWKHIKLLEEAGYEIESIRNKGYRLLSKRDCIATECIQPLLTTKMLGKQFLYFESINSTNTYLKREFVGNDTLPHGTVVCADEQTNGKGRRGRTWSSPKGQGIFMSILLKINVDISRIPQITLVAGLAVREALNQLYSLDFKIKWPNDIIYEGKKVCGILTEMSGEIGSSPEVIVGIGINANQSDFLEELKVKATSIRMITGEQVSRGRILSKVLNVFEDLMEQFIADGLGPMIELFDEHCANVDRTQSVSLGGEVITGLGIGINDNGELLLQVGEKEVAISSGEVSVTGIYE